MPSPRTFVLGLFAGLSFLGTVHAGPADPTPAAVTSALRRSADWHLAHPSGIDTRDWVIAPLYDGLLRTALTTGDASYLAAVLRFGTQSGWTPANRIYHADDQAVGHAWLDVFLMDRSRTERLGPMRDRLDYIIAHPVTEAIRHGKRPDTPGVTSSDRWTWCDALYMAPPTLTRLYAATGDRKYLDFLDREFRSTYDALFDRDESLFFRDATFLLKKTPSGQKTFWSRGNGWVYGGLALMLEHLPSDHPTRGFYEELFRKMTIVILAKQQADGLWRPSLLDPEQVPVGETSGTGFFVFGLAWGINHGLLDRATHWPAAVRGWNGLLSRIMPNGAVGYVQPIGAAPDALKPESMQDYGTGAFLLAGSEVLRALSSPPPALPADQLLKAANALLEKESRTPRAYARLVPERLDDLAWENDRVAFRVYGPALRNKPEDSGIDAWCKRVPYPVVDAWYERARLLKQSYHQDRGEGFDGYHVGDSRGCGGIGLWVDGKMVTADTYRSATILWTSPQIAEFKTVYEYPIKVRGLPVYEHRLTRLRLNERLFEVTLFFSHAADRRAQPIRNFPIEVAIGLVSQDKGATSTLDPKAGVVALYENFAGTSLGTGIVLPASQVLRMDNLPPTDADQKHGHAVVFTKTDADGRLAYRAGFAWAADGDITTREQWLNYLAAQASAPR